MLSICSIASSSSGNSAIIFDENTTILIDAGVSCKRISEGLSKINRTPEDIHGICITHSHSDHISGLKVLLKKTNAPLYMTEDTSDSLLQQIPAFTNDICTIESESPFQVGGLTVTAFSTPHDAPGSVGYSVTDGSRKCSIVTDLGSVTPTVIKNVLGSHLALVEANHDIDWLRTGPYPPSLKQRILGYYGHLSNEASGELCCTLAEHGTEKLILGHLSPHNNTPAHAKRIVGDMLARKGFENIFLFVASQNSISVPIEV